jgi:hypothetical protein
MSVYIHHSLAVNPVQRQPRECPTMYVVNDMPTVCVDQNAAIIQARAAFSRHGRPRC